LLKTHGQSGSNVGVKRREFPGFAIVNEITTAFLGYPLSVFNKNSAHKAVERVSPTLYIWNVWTSTPFFRSRFLLSNHVCSERSDCWLLVFEIRVEIGIISGIWQLFWVNFTSWASSLIFWVYSKARTKLHDTYWLKV